MSILKQPKTRIFLVCCATIVSLVAQTSAIAQVSITKSQFYNIVTPGQIHYFYNSEGGVTTVNIGGKGGPNVYDFSNFAAGPMGVSNNYFVSSLPTIAARYPGNAVTFGVSTDSVEKNPVFYFSGDTAYNLGEVSLVPQNRFRHNLPYPAIMVYPLTYGMAHAYTYTEYDTMYNGNGSVDSAWSNVNSDSITIDGYGTLKIRGYEVQCLRIKMDHRTYGDKEFMYLTREGLFLDVMLPQGQADTGTVQVENLMLLMAQTVTDVQSRAGAPLKFFLNQNYPNPFNPTTTIQYSLPEGSFVTLKVYDLLGREMRTLVNQRQSAGTKSVEFDAGSLPSGLYLYRLQAGSFKATKKIILIK